MLCMDDQINMTATAKTGHLDVTWIDAKVHSGNIRGFIILISNKSLHLPKVKLMAMNMTMWVYITK